MKGLLAATIMLAGCGFGSPEAGLPNAGGPDAAMQPDAGSTVDATPAARCTTYDVSYNGHRYRLVTTALTWAAARSNCESDGGYLLKLDSQSEDNQAALLINEQPEIWIGLNDIDQNGAYLWTDGLPPSFTRWTSTPAAGNCIVKNTSLLNDGRWYPRTCTDNKPAVCECNP